MILQPDIRRPMPQHRNGTVDCWVTSPAYWGQRNYGDDAAEMGRPGQALTEYLDDMSLVARNLLAMTKDDGVGWLNIGDTNAGSGGAGGDYNAGGRRDGRAFYKQGDNPLVDGQLCLVPLLVAQVFQMEGWLVRQDITWVKTVGQVLDGAEHGVNRLRPEDESHVRRPLFTTEHIFMLTKSRAKHHRWCSRTDMERGNAWHFPPARGNTHEAPFPDELVLRCLRLTFADNEMDNRHVVFDPFVGSGTTVRVAKAMGFYAFGADLYVTEGVASTR